jgi:hypothetical protein
MVLPDRSLFFAAAGFAGGIDIARQLRSEIGIPGCDPRRETFLLRTRLPGAESSYFESTLRAACF